MILSFSEKNTLSKECERFHHFPLYFSSPKAIPSLPLQTPK